MPLSSWSCTECHDTGYKVCIMCNGRGLDPYFATRCEVCSGKCKGSDGSDCIECGGEGNMPRECR